MARKPDLEPRWLVGLLNAVALRSLNEQTRSVGWYTVNPMLRDGIPKRGRSYEPTGYSDGDHKAALDALNLLPMRRLLAVARYFKPWAKQAIEAEHQWSDDTWMRELKAAMATLETELRLTVAESSICG